MTVVRSALSHEDTLCPPSQPRPQYEVADVFRMYGESYRASHTVTPKQSSVMHAIERCRSSALGYHLDQCDKCGHTEISYNSCRNRHCPKCQGIQRRKWVQNRLKDLLPVPYYHVVFTLPDAIFPMCLFNQEVIYNLLFDTAAETLLTFAGDKKWLGAQPGFFGILHTWGQTLCMHPHIHFIVPGGGIDENDQWTFAKHKDKFLFPIRAMSRVYRAKFIEGLKDAYEKGKLSFPGVLGQYESEEGFRIWVRSLCSNEWIVFTKAPFANPEQVVEYLGRYTHRIAISNRRIRSIENGRVVFSYKDYADNDQIKEMTLTGEEFMRRFLWHVLPAGFHKIRHYGFLANGMRKKLRMILEKLLLNRVDEIAEQFADTSCHMVCPVCGEGRLRMIGVIGRFGDWAATHINALVNHPKSAQMDELRERRFCLA